jgi:hypothetical protein
VALTIMATAYRALEVFHVAAHHAQPPNQWRHICQSISIWQEALHFTVADVALISSTERDLRSNARSCFADGEQSIKNPHVHRVI